MKTQTVIALGILAALGLGAYWLYTKSQATTNTTTVGIPIGSGGLTATIPTSTLAAGASSLLSGLISDIGGVFSGGSNASGSPAYAADSYSVDQTSQFAGQVYGQTDDSGDYGDYSE